MSKLKTSVGLAALTVLALSAGVAVALWTSTGTGTGRARALTAQTVTVSTATGAADLYPGFAGGDVHFSLTNANPYAVTFTSMTSGAVTSSNPTGCPSSLVTVADATGLSLSVGANASSGSLSIADIVTLSAAAPDACQGASFTVTLTLAGAQV